MCTLENRAGELKKWARRIQAYEMICGAVRNEGGLNSTKVEGHIRDLLDDLPLLVMLVALVRAGPEVI